MGKFITTLVYPLNKLFMAYIDDRGSEEVTETYRESTGEIEYIVVETDGGYFTYKFPIVPTPDYASDVDSDKVIDVATSDMKIIEAPDQPNRTEFTGMDPVTISKEAAETAESESGCPILE